MTRRASRPWSACVFLVLAVACVTAPAHGAEVDSAFAALLGSPPVMAAGGETPAPEACLETEATAGAPDETRYTLEQIIDMFGAHRVCNVPCGQPFQASCTSRCGEPAACFNYHCIYQ